MSRLGFVAYGAGIAGLTALLGPETVNAILGLQEYVGSFPATAACGWTLATFGPLALSALVWLLVYRFKTLWFFHFLFIPLAILAFRVGEGFAMKAVGGDGDSMLYGMPFVAGAAYLSLSLFVHIAALLALGWLGLSSRMNGS